MQIHLEHLPEATTFGRAAPRTLRSVGSKWWQTSIFITHHTDTIPPPLCMWCLLHLPHQTCRTGISSLLSLKFHWNQITKLGVVLLIIKLGIGLQNLSLVETRCIESWVDSIESCVDCIESCSHPSNRRVQSIDGSLHSSNGSLLILKHSDKRLKTLHLLACNRWFQILTCH